MRYTFLLVLVVALALVHVPCSDAWGRRAWRRAVSYVARIIYRPVNGGWSSWSSWRITDSCSESCGGGSQRNIRERTCNNPTPKHGGSDCGGSDYELQTVSCNPQPCPTLPPKVNGGWSELSSWSDYTTCTKTCGGGVHEKTKSRSCTNPKPANGGRDCPGKSSFILSSPCNNQPCPVDGGWSGWGSWSIDSPCTKTCGGGNQDKSRQRKCNKPETKNGGKYCVGDETEVQTVSCNQEACPAGLAKVDGKWSRWNPWSDYSSCTKTCGGGSHERTRSRGCTNPKPANGGRECPGRSSYSQTSPCNEQKCPAV